MVKGENRAKIKALAHKLGEFSLTTGHNIGTAVQTLFEDVVIHPTTRVVDFIGESGHGIFSAAEKNFKARAKAAQEGGGHFKVVFARPLFFDDGYVAPNHPKSDLDVALIDDALAHNFVFDHLPRAKRSTLIDEFEPIVVKKGTRIIEAGGIGDYFYVVGTGDVDFLIDGNNVGSVEEGGSFGELATPAVGVWPLLEGAFGERIYGFEQHTFSVSPIDNALARARSLPAGARLTLVSHGSGGLVADLLCAAGIDEALIEAYRYPPAKEEELNSQRDAAAADQRDQLRALRGVLAEAAELHRVLAQRVKATAVERLTVLMAVVVEVLAVQALQRRRVFFLMVMVGLACVLPLQGSVFSMLVEAAAVAKTILVIAAV